MWIGWVLLLCLITAGIIGLAIYLLWPQSITVSATPNPVERKSTFWKYGTNDLTLTKVEWPVPAGSRLGALAVSDQYICVAAPGVESQTGRVWVWNHQGDLLQTLSASGHHMFGREVSMAGDYLAVASEDGILLFEKLSLQETYHLSTGSDEGYNGRLQVTSAGQVFVGLKTGGFMRLSDQKTWLTSNQVQVLYAHQGTLWVGTVPHLYQYNTELQLQHTWTLPATTILALDEPYLAVADAVGETVVILNEKTQQVVQQTQIHWGLFGERPSGFGTSLAYQASSHRLFIGAPFETQYHQEVGVVYINVFTPDDAQQTPTLTDQMVTHDVVKSLHTDRLAQFGTHMAWLNDEALLISEPGADQSAGALYLLTSLNAP